MTNRPRSIGTAAETAVCRYLTANGWPNAERRSLKGAADQGDITGCPGLVIEVKGGDTARAASDGLIADWMAETEAERVNAAADIGVLVLQRRGVGAGNAGRWWAYMDTDQLADLLYPGRPGRGFTGRPVAPARLLLADVVLILRWAGYGQPLPVAGEAAS
jgi:hypothetical protein